MPVIVGASAFGAFERLLSSLCLNEFPCGSGSWRTSTGGEENVTQFTVTTKDYGADRVPAEALEELVISTTSPYSVDYSWSREARQLREMAVKSPWLLSRHFILKHFKSLRIVDKNVTEIDQLMLQFPELTELTLSANLLSSVESKHLPRSLTVLELVANEISDLSDLCADPPDLQHLGLSFNKITTVSNYLTGEYWPCLLSLDLSHNSLTELQDLVQALQTLPKLRNLALIGNPLALIPGYRGYVVDSLRSLIILDDSQISADEKHHFKGLARRGDSIHNEAQILVTIPSITGIPKPPEYDVIDEVPQYPIINRYYYVEFSFLEDVDSKKEINSISEGDNKELEDIDRSKVPMTVEDVSSQTTSGGEKTVTKSGGLVKDDAESPSTALDTQGPEGGPSDEGLHSSTGLQLKSYRTQGIQWTEETLGNLDVGYSQELIIDDLPALKQCLKEGLRLAIKEDKVLSYPPNENDDTVSLASHKKPAKGDKKEEKKVDKGGKKKKKEPEIELVHSPPVVTTLGIYTLDLGALNAGDHVTQEVCTCDAIERVVPNDESGESDKKKEKKKKGGSEVEVSKSRKGKEGKDKQAGKKTIKSAKPDRVGSSTKASPAKGPTEELSEGEPAPPPQPLTVAVRVELVKWNTAQDSIPREEPLAT